MHALEAGSSPWKHSLRGEEGVAPGTGSKRRQSRKLSSARRKGGRKGGRKGPAIELPPAASSERVAPTSATRELDDRAAADAATATPAATADFPGDEASGPEVDDDDAAPSSDQLTPRGPEKVQRAAPTVASAEEEQDEHAAFARARELELACGAHEQRARLVHEAEQRTEAMAEEAARELKQFRQARELRLLRASAAGKEGEAHGDAAMLAALSDGPSEATAAWGSGWLGQRQWQKERETHAVTLEKAAAEAEWLARDAEVAKAEAKELAEKGVLRKVRMQFFRNDVGGFHGHELVLSSYDVVLENGKEVKADDGAKAGGKGSAGGADFVRQGEACLVVEEEGGALLRAVVQEVASHGQMCNVRMLLSGKQLQDVPRHRLRRRLKNGKWEGGADEGAPTCGNGSGGGGSGERGNSAPRAQDPDAVAAAANAAGAGLQLVEGQPAPLPVSYDLREKAQTALRAGKCGPWDEEPKAPRKPTRGSGSDSDEEVAPVPAGPRRKGWWGWWQGDAPRAAVKVDTAYDPDDLDEWGAQIPAGEPAQAQAREEREVVLRELRFDEHHKARRGWQLRNAAPGGELHTPADYGMADETVALFLSGEPLGIREAGRQVVAAEEARRREDAGGLYAKQEDIKPIGKQEAARLVRRARDAALLQAPTAVEALAAHQDAEVAELAATVAACRVDQLSAQSALHISAGRLQVRDGRRVRRRAADSHHLGETSSSSASSSEGEGGAQFSVTRPKLTDGQARRQREQEDEQAARADVAAAAAQGASLARTAEQAKDGAARKAALMLNGVVLDALPEWQLRAGLRERGLPALGSRAECIKRLCAGLARAAEREGRAASRGERRAARLIRRENAVDEGRAALDASLRAWRGSKARRKKQRKKVRFAAGAYDPWSEGCIPAEALQFNDASCARPLANDTAAPAPAEQQNTRGGNVSAGKKAMPARCGKAIVPTASTPREALFQRRFKPPSSSVQPSFTSMAGAAPKKVAAGAESGKAGRKFRAFVAASGWVGDTRRGLVVGAPQPSIATWLEMHGAGHQGSLQGSAPTASAYHGRVDERQVRHLELKLMQEELEEEARLRRVKRRRAARQAPSSQPADVEERARVVAGLMQRPRGGRGGGEHLKLLMNRRGRGGVDEGASSSDDSGEEASSETRDLLLAIYFGGADKVPGRLVDGTDGLSVEEQVAKAHAPTAAERAAEARQEAIDAKERATAAAMPVASSEGEAAPRPILKGWAQRALLTAAAGRERRAARAKLTADEAARATARAKRLEQEARTEALRGEYMRKQQGEQEAEAKQKQEQMQKVLRSGAAAGTPLEKKAAADAEREMAAKAERVRQKAIATIQKRYAEVATKAGMVAVPPPPRTLIEGAVRLRRIPGAKSFSVFWAALSDDGVLRLWRDRQEAGVLLPHEIEAKELATAEVAAERAAQAADGSNEGSGDDKASVASGTSSRATSVGGTKRKRPRRTTRVVRALKWDGQGCTETYDNAFAFECNETAKVKVAAESGKPGGNMVQVQRRSSYQAMAASPAEAKQWGAAVGHAVAAAEQRREMRQAAEKRAIAKARRVAAEREAGKAAEHRATERLRRLERSKRDPRQGGGGIGEHDEGQVVALAAVGQLRPPNTKGGAVLEEEPTAEQLAEDEASREEARAAMEAAREANALQEALQAGADNAAQQEKRRCELENEQQAVDKEDGKAALAEMEALLALEGVDDVEREGAVRRAREDSEAAEAAAHAERCMLDEAELRAESQLAEVGQRDSKQGDAGADASDTQKKLAETSQGQQAPSQESDLFRSRAVMRAMGGGIAPQMNADMARAKASHWEHVKRGNVLKVAIALAKSTAKRWGRQKANGSTTTAAAAATAAVAASEEESAGGDPVRKLLGSRAAEELEKAKMELDAAGPLVQIDAKIFALKTRIAAGTALEMGNDSGGDDDDDDASSDVDTDEGSGPSSDEQKAQDYPSAAPVATLQEGKPTDPARVHVPPWAEELSHKRNGEALKPVRRPRETDPDAPAAAGRRAETSARAQALGREEQGEWMAVPGAEGTDGGDLTSHQRRPREQSVPAASSLSKKVFFLPNVLYKFKRTHPLGWRPGARDASGSITPAPDGEREIPSLDLSGLSVVPPPKTPPSSPPVRSGRRGGKPVYGGVRDDETVVFEPYRRLGWRWLGIGLSMKQRSRPKKAQVVRFEGRGSPTKARRRFLRLHRMAREQVETEAKVAAEATARGEATPEVAEDQVRTEAKEPVGDDKESLQDATQRKGKKGKKPKKSKKKHGAVVQPAVETFAEYWDDSSDTDDDFGNNAELKATKRAKQKGGERMVSANLHKNADMSHLESSAARGSKKATKIAERLKEAEAALVASELAADTLREKRTRAATRLAQEPTSLFSRSKEALYRAHPASYVHAVGRGVRNFYRTRFEAKVADLADVQPAPRLVFNWRLSRQARRADARVDKSIYRRPGCDGLSDEDDEDAPTTPRPVIQTRSMRRATKAMACDRCGAGAQHGSWRKWSLKRERRSTALPGEGGPSGAEALRMARVAGAKAADVTYRVAALAHNAVVTLLGWPMVQAAGSSARVVLHDDGLVLCRACAANELRGRSPRAPGEGADLSSQCDIHLPSSPRRTDAESAPGGRAKAATPTERREVAARREARAKRVRAQELEEVAPPLAIVVAFQAVAGPLLRAFERWRVRRERKRFELAVMVGSKEKIVDFFHQGFRDPCTVHFRDAQGRTALVLAAAQDHSGVAEFLVHMLKSIADKEEEKALRRGAAGAGDAPKPKPFYPEIDLDTRDERHGWAALHWAAHHGNGYLAHVLLSAGASLHARTKKGLTPLMVACAAGQAASSDVLLGADESLDHLVGGGVKITASKYPAWRKKMLAQLFMSPKLRDDNGMTALHHAAHAGSADCAMILLEADFSPRTKDGAHAIPSDYARRAGNDALILLLNEAMFGVDYHKHQNELEEEDDWFKSEKEKKRILRKKNRKIRRVNDARLMAAQIDFEAKEAETHTGKDLPSWWLGVDANGCAVDLGGGAQRSEGNAPDDTILLDLHEQQVAADARMQGAKEQRQRYAQYRRSDGLAPFAEAVSNPSDPQLNALQRLRFTKQGEMIDPGPEVTAIEAARRVTTPADAVDLSKSTHITHI